MPRACPYPPLPTQGPCRACHRCSGPGPTRKGPGLGVWCSAATVPKFIVIVPLRCPVSEVQRDSGACTRHLEPRLHNLRFLSPPRLLAACPPGPPGPQDALGQGVLRQSAAGDGGIHQACVFPQCLRARECSFSRLCVWGALLLTCWLLLSGLLRLLIYLNTCQNTPKSPCVLRKHGFSLGNVFVISCCCITHHSPN